MQSELRMGNSRAMALANVAAKAQQRRTSKQPASTRADRRSSPKNGTTQAKTAPPAPVLPNYSYNVIYPERGISYIWARPARNDRPGSDLQALKRLALSPVLGFDMEWRPNFIKGQPMNPVALIQLAGEHDIALVHVHLLRCIPQILQDILKDPDVLKVGVGIKDDAKKLQQDWQVEVVNTLDLSSLARQVDPHWDEVDQQKREAIEAARQLQRAQAEAAGTPVVDKPLSEEQQKIIQARKERREQKAQNASDKSPDVQLVSLSRLAARYLSLNLVKGKVSRSNWENGLIQSQVDYAANDASVAYDIHQRLQELETGQRVLPTS